MHACTECLLLLFSNEKIEAGRREEEVGKGLMDENHEMDFFLERTLEVMVKLMKSN